MRNGKSGWKSQKGQNLKLNIYTICTHLCFFLVFLIHELKVWGGIKNLRWYRTSQDLVGSVIVRKREKCLLIDKKRKIDKAKTTQTVELT